MEYSCELSSINKCLQDNNGVILPLCNSCQCQDCTNPIENIEYSVFGIIKKCRVFKRGNSPYFVISCSGYMSGSADEDEI